MKLYKYDIVLKRITEEDIEMIRCWRNADAIRQRMAYQRIITKRAQRKWFRSIDNFNNFYYLILHHGEAIGLFNEKNIDWERGTSETGLFIADEKYLSTHIPLMASLAQAETGFRVFAGQCSYARVLRDNRQALDYMFNFGYQICEGQEGEEVPQYALTAEAFEQKGARLLRAMDRLYPDRNILRVLFEERDYISGLAQMLEKRVAERGVAVKRHLDASGVWYYFREV